MLSAYPADTYAAEARALGAVAYLDKLSVPDLADILWRLCEAGD